MAEVAWTPPRGGLCSHLRWEDIAEPSPSPQPSPAWQSASASPRPWPPSRSSPWATTPLTRSPRPPVTARCRSSVRSPPHAPSAAVPHGRARHRCAACCRSARARDRRRRSEGRLVPGPRAAAPTRRCSREAPVAPAATHHCSSRYSSAALRGHGSELGLQLLDRVARRWPPSAFRWGTDVE